MAVQDQHLPVPWTAMVQQGRSAIAAGAGQWLQAGAATRARLWRLAQSDMFAIGLGGVLWSALIFAVIRAPI